MVTHQNHAEVRHVEETTPGTTPSNPAFLLFSKVTENVKFFLDKDLQKAQDLDNYEPEEFFSGKNVYGIEVSFLLYKVDRFLDFWERQSDGTPRSYTVEIIPDSDAASPEYIRATGWRAKDATLEGEAGGAYKCSVVFEAGTIDNPTTTDPGVGSTGSREAKSAITAALKKFSGGVIQKGGADWATVVSNLEVTCSHGTEGNLDTGSEDPEPAAAQYGNRSIEGSADITYDDPFSGDWTETKDLSTSDIVIPFGTSTGDPKLTLQTCAFPKLEAELNNEGGLVEGGRPFHAKSFAEGSV